MRYRFDILVFALLALCLLLAGWQAHPAAWGFHSYGFLPRGAWFGAGLMLALLLLPRLAGRVSGAMLSGITFVQSRIYLVLLLSLISAAVFYLGRLRYQFLGDGQLWADLIDQGKSFHHFEPLTSFLVSGLARVVDSDSPGQAAGALSIILGAAFLFVTAQLSRSLWISHAASALAWGLLVLHPVLLFWFGYIESYPLVHLLQALLAWSLVLSVRGRLPIVFIVLLMAFANASHILTIGWWPSLALLVWWRQRQRGNTTPRLGVVALHSLGLFAAVVACIGLLWWILQVSPVEILSRLTSERGTGSLTVQWFFSKDRLLDLINELALLLAPAIVLAVGCALAGARPRAFLRTPAGSVIIGLLPGPLLTLLVVPPLLGGARDWDLYAALSLPMVLWAVHMWAQVCENATSAKTPPRGKGSKGSEVVLEPRMAVIAARSLGLAVAWTAGWLAVELDTTRAAERFLLLQDPRGTYGSLARAHANEALGIFYRPTGGLPEYEAWVRATEADPYNPRYYVNRANAALRLKRIAEAQQMFEKALERGLHEWHIYYNLGICGLKLNDPATAERRFTQLIDEWPQEWRGWNGRGEARLRLKQPEAAVGDLQRLVQLRPNYARGYWVLGYAYRGSGREAEAQAAWRRAVEIDPTDQATRKLLTTP